MDMEAESSRPPAPGALALVQTFVNTYDVAPRREELNSAQALRAWLVEHGLLHEDEGEPLSDADLHRALEAREALRALLEANNGAPVDAAAVTTLNRIAEGAHLRVQFERDGHAQLAPAAGGVDTALGRLLAIVSTAMAEGTWTRLKVCRSETCRWAFYDSSKNRSGAWCTMAVCGSRVKARTYRQRRRQRSGAT
jgi:predicted RNA-binding Zn ribbon-like protein